LLNNKYQKGKEREREQKLKYQRYVIVGCY
jgi:hypothetical protein